MPSEGKSRLAQIEADKRKHLKNQGRKDKGPLIDLSTLSSGRNEGLPSWSEYYLKNPVTGLISSGFLWLMVALFVLQIIILYWHIILITLFVAGFSFLLYKYFQWKNER